MVSEWKFKTKNIIIFILSNEKKNGDIYQLSDLKHNKISIFFLFHHKGADKTQVKNPGKIFD